MDLIIRVIFIILQFLNWPFRCCFFKLLFFFFFFFLVEGVTASDIFYCINLPLEPQYPSLPILNDDNIYTEICQDKFSARRSE